MRTNDAAIDNMVNRHAATPTVATVSIGDVTRCNAMSALPDMSALYEPQSFRTAYDCHYSAFKAPPI